MSRKKSREYAFKLVFEKFFHEPDVELLDLEEDVLLEDDKSFACSLINGVNDNYDAIIDIVKSNVVGYEIERLYKIDLAILVLAIYELKFAEDGAQPSIVINEAVELSKKYSTDKSYSFINGVLAKVINNVW